MNFFSSKTHISTSFTQAFYLLAWTCFNDVSMGRNILINSQLKSPFSEQWQGKMKQNWEREKKHEKENSTDESDFSENEIPHLNSLKPF